MYFMKCSIPTIFLFASLCIGCFNSKTNNEIIPPGKSNGQLPYLTYQKANLFPGDGSLLRPEDGVCLPDGRVIVVDQAKGLRLINENGSNRPFGDFAGVRFLHNPPETIAAPNGIF